MSSGEHPLSGEPAEIVEMRAAEYLPGVDPLARPEVALPREGYIAQVYFTPGRTEFGMYGGMYGGRLEVYRHNPEDRQSGATVILPHGGYFRALLAHRQSERTDHSVGGVSLKEQSSKVYPLGLRHKLITDKRPQISTLQAPSSMVLRSTSRYGPETLTRVVSDEEEFAQVVSAVGRMTDMSQVGRDMFELAMESITSKLRLGAIESTLYGLAHLTRTHLGPLAVSGQDGVPRHVN